MTDPQTPTVGFYDQTTGSNTGTWGTVLNANFSASDSLAGNVSIIPLSGSSVTLSTPPTSGAAWAGPYQSQSAILRTTGTLSTNCFLIFPRPGFWIVENLCTVGGFVVALTAVGGTNFINAPPGEACHVYCDGSKMQYVNLPPVGSYMDLGATVVPQWIINQTIPPYLNCNGSSFSAVTYPALAALLGGTTLPDSRGRFRANLNQGTVNLVNTVNGNVLFAGGSSETTTLAANQIPSLTTSTETGNHSHNSAGGAGSSFVFSGGAVTGNLQGAPGSAFQVGLSPLTSTQIGTHTHTVGTGSPAAVPTVPPVYIGGITLIRAA